VQGTRRCQQGGRTVSWWNERPPKSAHVIVFLQEGECADPGTSTPRKFIFQLKSMAGSLDQQTLVFTKEACRNLALLKRGCVPHNGKLSARAGGQPNRVEHPNPSHGTFTVRLVSAKSAQTGRSRTGRLPNRKKANFSRLAGISGLPTSLCEK
jgi:hypothetical protein